MKRVLYTVFSIIPLMLLFQLSQGQDYVVTTTGDTLRGTIKSFNFGDGKKVQVTDSQKKKTQVPILKTRAYSLKGEIFNPVKTETGYQYMKLLQGGYLSLYAFIPDKMSSYDGRFLLKRDGKGMEVPNLSFKRMMTKFLDDCSVVSNKIEQGELGKRDLNQIILEYNKCVESQSRVYTVAAAQKIVAKKQITAWDSLEQKVKTHADFEGKTNALEMIAEIKSKIEKDEKIPNFLTEGLKNALAQTELKDELARLLADNP